MNRRSFINLLGSAIIGTAIVLKLPDSIMPTFAEWSPKAIEASVEPYFVGIYNYKELLNRKNNKSKFLNV